MILAGWRFLWCNAMRHPLNASNWECRHLDFSQFSLVNIDVIPWNTLKFSSMVF